MWNVVCTMSVCVRVANYESTFNLKEEEKQMRETTTTTISQYKHVHTTLQLKVWRLLYTLLLGWCVAMYFFFRHLLSLFEFNSLSMCVCVHAIQVGKRSSDFCIWLRSCMTRHIMHGWQANTHSGVCAREHARVYAPQFFSRLRNCIYAFYVLVG